MRNQLNHFCRRCISYGTFTRLDSKSGAETLEICDGTVSKLIQAGKDVEAGVVYSPLVFEKQGGLNIRQKLKRSL